jgi:beta-lactamase class A
MTTVRRRIRRAYRRATTRAGGSWHALITMAGPDGAQVTVVVDRADEVVPAASVNKLGVACAVLDKVDRGELRLDQKLELIPEIILFGDGIYHLQGVWGDRVTLANVLTALLVVSDNTAVRLCGLVCPGDEVNAYLAGKGFRHTRVEPVPDHPHRMFLGRTTAREAHALISRLVAGTMVSPAATRLMLDLMRAAAGDHDGVRQRMSSWERDRTPAKQGTDEGCRHEVGALFDADPGPAAPEIVFSFFADLPSHAGDLGGTNPLVRARATLGRCMRDQMPPPEPDPGTGPAPVPSTVDGRRAGHRATLRVGPAQQAETGPASASWTNAQVASPGRVIELMY